MTEKKGKKKTIKVKNIRKITKVKSSKKSVVTAKKKGKKIVLKGKKKGTATVKVTVKNLKGKKQTLKVKVRVGKGNPNNKNVKKKGYTKDGRKYISKWGYAASKEFFIEDQKVSAKLISADLDTNNGAWVPNPNPKGEYWYNTYTFAITNHRSGSITIKKILGDTGYRNYTDAYWQFYRQLPSSYDQWVPDIWYGIGLFTDSDVVIQPSETRVVTWSQPEGCTLYSSPQNQYTNYNNHWLKMYYKDELGRRTTMVYEPSHHDVAFWYGWDTDADD